MSFLKSLWSFTKAHRIGAFIAFVVVLPLVFGSIALMVYRAVKFGVTKVAPSIGDKLPAK